MRRTQGLLAPALAAHGDPGEFRGRRSFGLKRQFDDAFAGPVVYLRHQLRERHRGAFLAKHRAHQVVGVPPQAGQLPPFLCVLDHVEHADGKAFLRVVMLPAAAAVHLSIVGEALFGEIVPAPRDLLHIRTAGRIPHGAAVGKCRLVYPLIVTCNVTTNNATLTTPARCG